MYYFDGRAFHVFEKCGRYFLIGANLTVFEINEICYLILTSPQPITIPYLLESLGKTYSGEEIQESLDCLLEWEVLNSIVSPSTSKRQVQPVVPELKPWQSSLTGLTLVITQDCNLRCKYCSAEYGRFGSSVSERLMSRETAHRSVDFFLAHLAEGVETVPVTLTGGEPLMNFEVIKFVVQYCRSKTKPGFEFSLNTNGILMTPEKARWFSEQRIPVRFSIDGTEGIHNQNRVYPDGRGSYKDVLRGLQNYKACHLEGFAAQASIPHGKHLEEAIHNLWGLGAYHILENFTSDSPYMKDDSLSMTTSDYSDYMQQWDRLCQEYVNQLIRYGQAPAMGRARTALKSIHRRELNIPGCGYMWNISITPDGKFHACQGVVGPDEFVVGDLDRGFDTEHIKSLMEVYTRYLHKCDDCWARNFCGAACIALASMYNELGEEFKSGRFCTTITGMYETCAYMYLSILEQRPQLLDELFPVENKRKRTSTTELKDQIELPAKSN